MGDAEKHSHPARKGAKPADDLPPFDQWEDMGGDAGPGAVLTDKLPSKKPGFHWTKTTLGILGKDGKLLVFASDKGERFYVGVEKLEESKGTETYSNMLAVVKGRRGPLHVRWIASDDGRKFILKVLDDAQYETYMKDANRHRKMMRHGFQTQNAWMS